MILKTVYPNSETKKEIIVTSSIVGIVLYLLLIIYQPFGTSQFEHTYKYLLLFPYAVISALSFSSVDLLLTQQKKNWTIGEELLKVLLILLLISTLSYLYNSLFLSKVNLSFENYLYMFAYTSALGLPVCALYIMARYIYHTKKNFSPEVDPTSNNQFEILTNKFIENKPLTRLRVVADYADVCLEIEQDDFVYAEAADNYCLLHFYEKDILKKEIIRISLTKLLISIQSDTIKKVHRSYVVNLKKVTKYKGNASGYKISLENIEKELTVSRNYIDLVVPFLKNFVPRP